MQRPPPSDMAGAAVEKRTRRSDGQKDWKARGRVHTILGTASAVPDTQRSGRKCAAYAEQAGRDPDAIEFGTVLWFCLDDDRERAWKILETESDRWRSDRPTIRGQANVSGYAEDCVAAIQEYVDAGVTHFVMYAAVPPSRTMQQYEQFAREVLPLVRGIVPSK